MTQGEAGDLGGAGACTDPISYILKGQGEEEKEKKRGTF
jgi:hypothetical protein